MADQSSIPEVISVPSSPEDLEQEEEDLMSKAASLKMKLEENVNPLAPVGIAVSEKFAPQTNSTNLRILRLHDDQGLSWAEIAAELNAAQDKGKTPTLKSEAELTTPTPFTAELVYSRYIRTPARLSPPTSPKPKAAAISGASAAGPFTAPGQATVPSSSLYFDRTNDRGRPTHMKPKKAIWDDEMDMFLVEAVQETRAEFWGTVARRVREKTEGKREVKPEECQGRYFEL